MSVDRRFFLAATTATGAWSATEAVAAPSSTSVPVSGLGVDAFHLGVRTASPTGSIATCADASPTRTPAAATPSSTSAASPRRLMMISHAQTTRTCGHGGSAR